MSIVNAELNDTEMLDDLSFAILPILDRYLGWMTSRSTLIDLTDSAALAVRALITSAEGKD